jgi:hypothetical protein
MRRIDEGARELRMLFMERLEVELIFLWSGDDG